MTAPCPRCADLTWHDGELQRQAARAVDAERQRDEAQRSLRERTAERDALIERVSVLEDAQRTEPAGSALVHEVSGHGANDGLWRPGETAAECWARHIREAEARGRRGLALAVTRAADAEAAREGVA